MTTRSGTGGMTSLGTGLRTAARNARLLWWLLGANIAVSVAAVAPLLDPLDRTLSHRPDPAGLADRLDMAWWVDVTTAHAEAFARTIDVIGVAAFLSAILGCFFAGGLLQAYNDTIDRLGMDRFLTACRRWFVRFAWLFLLSLPLYWLVHRMINTHLADALSGLLDRVEDERTGLMIAWGRALIFLALFDAVTLVSDYARVHAVVIGERSMLACLGAAMRFVLRHPWRVWSLEAGSLALQAAAIGLFVPIDSLIGRGSPAGLASGLVATQALLLLRLYLRESSRAGQVVVYRRAAIKAPAGS